MIVKSVDVCSFVQEFLTNVEISTVSCIEEAGLPRLKDNQGSWRNDLNYNHRSQRIAPSVRENLWRFSEMSSKNIAQNFNYLHKY